MAVGTQAERKMISPAAKPALEGQNGALARCLGTGGRVAFFYGPETTDPPITEPDFHAAIGMLFQLRMGPHKRRSIVSALVVLAQSDPSTIINEPE